MPLILAAHRVSNSVLAAVSLVSAAASPVFADEEIVVGHNGEGRLAVLVGFAQPLPLDPSVFPGIIGYATGTYGFANADIDMPASGVFMLDLTADIEATLISADNGIQIYDGLSVLPVGGTMFFGTPFFDYHPVFNITQGVPGVPQTLRFVVRDRSGIYADSAAFDVVFTPQYCAADFNFDGAVDFFDYDDFVACFEGGACPAGHSADFNADTAVDFFDYDDFVSAFEAPC